MGWEVAVCLSLRLLVYQTNYSADLSPSAGLRHVHAAHIAVADTYTYTKTFFKLSLICLHFKDNA